MLNLLNNSFNNILFYYINKAGLINTNSLVLDNSFVDNFIIVLICFSLSLTFYKKGTPIHKVIGLLLTSIFVVFLWILKTQFLFIYIVYILAFISAVLMLFLSVVLMLPISHSNNLRKINNRFYNNIILFFIYDDAALESGYTGYPNFTFILIFIILALSIYFLKAWKKNFVLLKNNVKVHFNIKSFILICVQIYLFINIFLFFIGNFLIKQDFIRSTNDIFLSNKDFSLGALKYILYDSHANLMLSCLCVLLVALVGAAILTKFNKK